MSIVFDVKTGQVIRTVRNLGWLLRHWKDVTRFEVCAVKGTTFQYDAILTAFLGNGTAYRTEWACLPVCFDWLNRPVFRGVPCDYYPVVGYPVHHMKCGDKLTFGKYA